jgi:nucleoside-diphosphate-sugar epimerase
MTRTVAQWIWGIRWLPTGMCRSFLTKRLGRVIRSPTDGTVILRPKAIYGIGDTAIFPRLITAAAKGRLPIVGDGDTVTNLTHVDDVVDATLLALESAKAVGNTYVITGGEDVRIWDVICDVVVRSGFRAPTRHIAVRRVMRAAKVLEWVWRTFRLPGEPPITTYTAGILGLSQTYDITAARRDLGYKPKVTIARGVEESFDAASAPSHLTALNRLPALFAIIEHPDQGLCWDFRLRAALL